MMTLSDLYDSATVWLANGQPHRAKRMAEELRSRFKTGGDKAIGQDHVDDILARAYLSTSSREDAFSALEHSCALVDRNPENPVFWCNLCANWLKCNRWEHAIDAAKRAVEIDPECIDGYAKMANCLHAGGRHEDRIALDRKVYELSKSKSDAVSVGLAMMTAAGGDPRSPRFREGMQWMFERHISPYTRPHTHEVPYPVLLEQGVGDCIMMMPYMLESGRNIFGCGVHKAHNDVLNAAQILCEDNRDRFSASQAMVKAPHELMFGLMLDIDTSVKKRWPDLPKALPTDHKGKVGVTWRGNPKHPNDYFRSLQFSDILPVLQHYGDRCVVLQMDITPEERAAIEKAGCAMYDREGLVDLIGAIHGLKELICVDTACVHIAGRAGVPTKLMLSTMIDWRWGLSGNETHWYPSVSLYRQPALGDWDSVIHEVLQ